MLLLFKFLQLQAMDSFIGVRFSLMYSFVSALKLNLSLLILLSFFLLSRAFLQCFLLTKQIIVFLDLVFLPVFPNRWQVSISSDCILTPMSDKTEETVFSNGYLVYFLKYLIKQNCFFYHTVPRSVGFVQGLPLCFPKYYILLSVFHFHLVTV